MSRLITRDDALAVILDNSKWPKHKAIEDIPAIDAASIREDALREAAAICINVSNDVWTQMGREHERWMKATAEDCSKMILALIGEQK